MVSNGNGHRPAPRLSVLVTGSAASGVAGALEQEHAISVLRNGDAASSSADVAVHVVASSSAPNVADEVRQIRALTDAPLILAAYGEPNGIVETGLALGATDVLVLPQPAETLLFAVRKAALGAPAGARGTVVTVFSPKGGSGKTVLATNLAVASARSGRNTLLVDLDLQFGDSALTLAVSPRATIKDLAGSAGEIDVEKLKAFVSTDARTGVSVLPAPQRPEEADLVTQADLAAVLAAARSAYDAVVVDTGPLFDGAMLAALDCTDRLLLVCNPEVTSLKNVRIGLETIDALGFDRGRVSLVANRIGSPGAVGRDDIESALDAEIAFELPDDPAVPAAVNRALPVVVSDDKSRFTRSVKALEESVFGDVVPNNEERPAKSHRRFLVGGRR